MEINSNLFSRNTHIFLLGLSNDGKMASIKTSRPPLGDQSDLPWARDRILDG